MASIKELFPSRWLSAADLQGQDYTLVIRRVTLEEMRASKTEQTQKPVAWFADVQKGMVLNKTNALVIAQLYGDDTDKWAGKPVTLYPVRERAFGQDWDVIRVRPSRPAMPASAPRVTEDNGHGHKPDTIDALDRNGIVAMWSAQNKTFVNLPASRSKTYADETWALDIPKGTLPADVKAMLRERAAIIDVLLAGAGDGDEAEPEMEEVTL